MRFFLYLLPIRVVWMVSMVSNGFAGVGGVSMRDFSDRGKPMTDTENQKADLLYGAPAIASYLGLTEDAVYHLARLKRLPTFRMGRTICARRSTLAAKIAELEAKSSAA